MCEISESDYKFLEVYFNVLRLGENCCYTPTLLDSGGSMHDLVITNAERTVSWFATGAKQHV